MFDFLRSLAVRVVQSGSLENSEVGFDQIQPRGVRRRPVDMDTPGNFGRQGPQGLLVGAKVVHHKMNAASGPTREHVLQPEGKTGLRGFLRESRADGLAGVRAESREPLEGAVAFVAVRPTRGSPAPRLAASRDRLQGAHFVKADNLTPPRRVAVKANYSVFFTSNSGSSLSHHV